MKKDFKRKLSAATCALLSAAGSSYASEKFDSDLDINTSFLLYDEVDRVTTATTQVNVKKIVTEDDTASFSLAYDTITGATPTGEVPFGSVQTVTSPSGNTSTVSASTKPFLNVKDERTAISGSWQHQLTRLVGLSFALNKSTEGDYDSEGKQISVILDNEDKLTTWSLGVADTNDTISRSSRADGVAGVPLEMSNSALLQRQSQNETRKTQDLSIGLTQVLTSNTLMQLTLSKSESDGYHTDPYKLLSVVDGNGIQVASYYEKRPNSRSRDIFYGGLIHNMGGDVLRADFRYYTDDWGIVSNTFDLKYRWKSGNWFYEPRIRFYKQSAADFHKYYLNASDSLPDFASADSRLDAFKSNTLGFYTGFEVKNYVISARLEYMSQSGSSDNQSVPIKLKSYNLFNGVDAYIMQVNFRMYF